MRPLSIRELPRPSTGQSRGSRSFNRSGISWRGADRQDNLQGCHRQITRRCLRFLDSWWWTAGEMWIDKSAQWANIVRLLLSGSRSHSAYPACIYSHRLVVRLTIPSRLFLFPICTYVSIKQSTFPKQQDRPWRSLTGTILLLSSSIGLLYEVYFSEFNSFFKILLTKQDRRIVNPKVQSW